MGASGPQRTQWGRDHWATPTLEASLPENLEAEPSRTVKDEPKRSCVGTVVHHNWNGCLRWKCPCLDYQVHQRSMNKKHVTAYIYIYIYDAASYLWTKIVANKRTILSKPSPSRKKHSPSPFGMASFSCPCETWLNWHLMVVFWASQKTICVFSWMSLSLLLVWKLLTKRFPFITFCVEKIMPRKLDVSRNIPSYIPK